MRRRIAHAVAALAMIAIAATAALAITSQTMWFKNWLRGFIVREASQYVNGTLSIGGLEATCCSAWNSRTSGGRRLDAMWLRSRALRLTTTRSSCFRKGCRFAAFT